MTYEEAKAATHKAYWRFCMVRRCPDDFRPDWHCGAAEIEAWREYQAAGRRMLALDPTPQRWERRRV